MEMGIFDNWIDAVLVLDLSRKLQYVNEAFSTLVEVSQRRIKKDSVLSDWLSLEDPEHWLGQSGDWSGPDRLAFREMPFRTPKGKSGRVQVTVNRDGDKVIAFLRDVSLEEALQKKYRLELEQKEAAFRQLEEYNLTLEQRVRERTQQLLDANQTISAILDSLGQGFFLFGPDGICGGVFSRACEAIVECKPAGLILEDVLRVPDAKRGDFARWRKALFTDLLPVVDLIPLGPKEFPHSHGLYVELAYRAIHGEDGKVRSIVVIATDRTREKVARREAERERANAQLITRIVMSRNQFQQFLRQLRDLALAMQQEMVLGSRAYSDRTIWLRRFHTLKGDAGAYGLLEIERLAHQSEEALTANQLELLGGLGHQISEELKRIVSEYGSVIGRGWDQSDRWLEIPASQVLKLSEELSQNPLTQDMGEAVVAQFLSEPVDTFFSHYSGIVERLARELGKQVAPLEVIGGDLRVRPEVLLPVAAEFIHVFRNMVDHGVETPEQREQLGKPIAAKIALEFSRKSTGALSIEASDDGPGIDPEQIRKRLLARGASAKNLAQESDSEVIQHIFDAGFSTRDQVSLVSGRGVGLDALRSAVTQANGRVWVSSVRGKGSRIHVELTGIWSQQAK